MNYLKVLILSIMKDNRKDCVTRAMTVNEVTDALGNTKNITVYKALSELYMLGFIERGLKNGRAMTYYITEAGINKYYEYGGK